MPRIIQVTDMHIGTESDYPLGVDLRGNYLAILEAVKRENPAHIIFTGDFCLNRPLREVYDYHKDIIDQLEIPYSCIPGNHDDKDMMAKTFGLSITAEKETYTQINIQGQDIVLLDSKIGSLSTTQKKWLEEKLSDDADTFLVFIHHPPTLAGLPHMDQNHSLSDHEEVWSILQRSNKEVYVFCGHYHTDRSIHDGNVHLFVTPSLYVQISDSTPSFKVEHYYPGYRVIDVEGKRLRTTTKYVRPRRF